MSKPYSALLSIMEILLFILLPIFIYVFMSTDNCIDYSEVVEKMKKDIDKKEEK